MAERRPHRFRIALAAVLGLLAATGCERKADTAHPKSFDAEGLAFRYPGNWKVSTSTKEISSAHLRVITVETPGDGLVMVEEFRPALPIDLKEFLGTMVDEMRKELAGKTKGILSLERPRTTPVTRTILGAPRDGLRYQFELGVLGEKVAETTDGYLVTLPDRALIFVMQAPDEDRGLVEPGFAQLLDGATVRAR